MLIRRSLRWTIVTALFAIALIVPASQAQVTFTGPATITVTEDGSSQIFYYVLSNNSGGPISNIGGAPGTFSFGSPSGDISDIYAVATISVGTCFTVVTLPDGSSCNFFIEVTPQNGAGETDGDSYAATFTIGAQFDTVNPLTGGLQTQDLVQSVLVTINDPTVAPEPSSFLLLGSGLGMLGTLRRKLSFLNRS